MVLYGKVDSSLISMFIVNNNISAFDGGRSQKYRIGKRICRLKKIDSNTAIPDQRLSFEGEVGERSI